MKIIPTDVLAVGYKFVGRKPNGNSIYAKPDEDGGKYVFIQEFLSNNEHFAFYTYEKSVVNMLSDFFAEK